MEDNFIYPVGDCAIRVQFGNIIDYDLNRTVHDFVRFLHTKRINGVVDVVPSNHSVTIYYNPTVIKYEELSYMLSCMVKEEQTFPQNRRTEKVIIPTLYGGEVGEDIKRVAKLNSLSEEEVIQLHSELSYPIYMMGFLPGFAYLGGLNPKLYTPRLDTPRLKTIAGSVGIGGQQTGIYPIDSPGGWNVIGRTPLSFFNPLKKDPFLCSPGMILKFEPITKEEYKEIEEKVRFNHYEVKRELIKDES